MPMYHSTRSATEQLTAKSAVLAGIAPDGGLYVTDDLSDLRFDLSDITSKDFRGIARQVLGRLFDDYADEEIAECVDAAYGSTFDSPAVTPLVPVGDDYVLELFHGPTSAFKDVALQMLPQLMSHARRDGERVMILTATSGDTGKAALAGFADTPGLGIAVFYPQGGTSDIQRLQMTTQEGGNVSVCAIEGNFDDAQSGVKKLFVDTALHDELADAGVRLSSANSINIGRLAPQITYYFDAYAQLLRAGAIELGDEVEFCVPTGNFGDVLAGWYARELGLPVARFIVASNANDVLTDFFATGAYDRNRPFFRTISPSMDILISSNLERLIYYMGGRDAAYVNGLMEDLAHDGRYEVRPDIMDAIRTLFAAGSADDDATRAEIAACRDAHGYVLDPHTAVAVRVARDLPRTAGAKARIILATASPYKFAADVCEALGIRADAAEPFDCMRALEDATGTAAPRPLSALEGATERFDDAIAPEQMRAYVVRACKEATWE